MKNSFEYWQFVVNNFSNVIFALSGNTFSSTKGYLQFDSLTLHEIDSSSLYLWSSKDA